jgi:hypothetical protein
MTVAITTVFGEGCFNSTGFKKGFNPRLTLKLGVLSLNIYHKQLGGDGVFRALVQYFPFDKLEVSFIWVN